MNVKIELAYERTVFDNGLVLLISESHKLPLVSLNAYVRCGLDQNPEDHPGLASLTARMLDEGTEKFSYRQIAEMVEGSGGAASIFSQRELSGINIQLRSEDWRLGLELLDQMVCHPVFPSDRTELEKEKVLNHLRAMEDEPQTVASNAFNRIIYNGSPLAYPVLGVPDNLAVIQAPDLLLFHREKYGPEATILVICGDVTTKEVLAEVEERFSRWHNPDLRRLTLPDFQRQQSPVYESCPMDKEQLHILVGHLGITRHNTDFPALQVLDVILGNGPGFTSRIPRKLRDEQGLAYSTYSDMTSSSGLYPGRFSAYICTSPENGKAALKGMLDEIRDVAANGVTDEELETAKDYLTGSFVFDIQSIQLVARFLLSVEFFDLGPDYISRYPALIENVTREEVEQVARRYLDTVNYTTVIAGPV